ncbi:hypothetical protein AIOL_003649 [Candidatus Rhodobacter oscarellae]|uniref:Uncharacterized protein n=1 Tax=Candidatus Rhodobacter oscarellae TaxID=1675527 RepID=A0A0J9E7D1_9RHOB|nr:hypothetical protein AIOL_003649 [Candidatus Rhodobacter lobularis]
MRHLWNEPFCTVAIKILLVIEDVDEVTAAWDKALSDAG